MKQLHRVSQIQWQTFHVLNVENMEFPSWKIFILSDTVVIAGKKIIYGDVNDVEDGMKMAMEMTASAVIALRKY